MRKLSKYEKETIINWNEAEDTVSIYTFKADLKRRLAEFSRKYPQLCRLERRQRDLCDGQVTTFDPAGAAVQRRTAGSCKGVRKRAWLSGHTDRRKNRLK